jgi:hypothetical protein
MRKLCLVLTLFLVVLRDIERRAGGNPFDNRNTIYNGTPEDNALNDGVQRYAADPGALADLQHYYTPTAGSGDFFVAHYVKHDGHCNITPAEIERGLTELIEWKEKGTRPAPVACNSTPTLAPSWFRASAIPE